ncbi:penicillin-binding protein 2 [Candidatus Falkowbacteria bacterium]|nr:penicillin-binding protein 2 [Candidatus Falkowbacteria bacterium]
MTTPKHDHYDWYDYNGGDFASNPSTKVHTVVSPRTTLYASIMLFALAFILFSRSLYLQVIKGREYASLSFGNSIRKEILVPDRGIIYDAQKNPLVVNIPQFSLTITPSLLPRSLQERGEYIQNIARQLQMSDMVIFNVLSDYPMTHKYEIPIITRLTYKEALTLITKVKSFNALRVSISTHREYLNPNFSHVLGYTGKVNEHELSQDSQLTLNDNIGKTGLELYYEKALRGSKGEQEVEVDSFGKSSAVISQSNPVSGDTLVLSIDQRFQDKVTQILRDHMSRYGKHKGVVVASDPKSGAIKAFVSLPQFDNNDFSGEISYEQYEAYTQDKNLPLYNRVINGEYPSGSTVKTVVAAAALEESVIQPQTSIFSSGGIWVQRQWYFPDWKAGGHGQTNVYKAIADSVNTFFYYVGGGYESFEGLGLDRLISYFKKFGLGDVTGIDMPHESNGFVPTREWKSEAKNEEWYIGDTYHIAIGQGDLLVTPLQVQQYTSYFANNGKAYKPFLVSSIIDEDLIEKKTEPQIAFENVVSKESSTIVREGMRRGVTEGSSRYLEQLPFSSAGKTGTAQFAKNKPPHAWFTGFAPYDDPELVVTVLIEEGIEGSTYAVPVAYEVFKAYFELSDDAKTID